MEAPSDTDRDPGISANFDPLDHWPECQPDPAFLRVPHMCLLFWVLRVWHTYAGVSGLSQGQNKLIEKTD